MIASDTIKIPHPFLHIPAWVPLLAFILIIFLIGAAGYAISEKYKKSIIDEEVQNLGAIADLKSRKLPLGAMPIDDGQKCFYTAPCFLSKLTCGYV